VILYVPLAWLQLTHQRVRFITTLAGIAFVVIILFMQLGFQDALFASAIRVHQSLQGDLFLISTQYNALTSQQSFPRTRLYQALAFDDVESVSPLYIQFGKLKNLESGQKYPIFVFGIDPGKPTFNLSEINQSLDKLKTPNMALFDRESRADLFGPIAKEFEQGKVVRIEIAPYNTITKANRLKISGLYSIGPSFGVDGDLIINYSTFLNIFIDRIAEEIDIGLVNLKPGVDPQKALATLVAYLPKDVKVLTRQGFTSLEKHYWDVRTIVGFTFKLMVTLGFIIGVGVVYQILYSNVSNHLVAYATLKAIGYKNNYLLGLVFQQALILAVVGYIPGLIISLGLYDLAKNATHLPMVMTIHQSSLVLIVVVLMCSISGILAVQKLRAADPSDIF